MYTVSKRQLIVYSVLLISCNQINTNIRYWYLYKPFFFNLHQPCSLLFKRIVVLFRRNIYSLIPSAFCCFQNCLINFKCKNIIKCLVILGILNQLCELTGCHFQQADCQMKLVITFTVELINS